MTSIYRTSMHRPLGALLVACGALMMASGPGASAQVRCCDRGDVAISASGVECTFTIYALYDDGHREYFKIGPTSKDHIPCYNKMIGVFIVDCNGKSWEITLDGPYSVPIAPGCCIHVGVKLEGENMDCYHIYFSQLAEKCNDC